MHTATYYKIKTKKFFQDKGYQVEYLEKSQRVIPRSGKAIWVKKDIFGADLIALNDKEIILINSKLNRKNIARGIKEFKKFPSPPQVKKWIVIWKKRQREPEIIEV